MNQESILKPKTIVILRRSRRISHACGNTRIRERSFTNVQDDIKSAKLVELQGNRDIDILKMAGLDRSITYYEDLKKKKPV